MRAARLLNEESTVQDNVTIIGVDIRKNGFRKKGTVICDKCGEMMVADHDLSVNVMRCWKCGNRTYLGFPKRLGHEPDETDIARSALHNRHYKGRAYGPQVCPCGVSFIKKGPTQIYHSKECRAAWPQPSSVSNQKHEQGGEV